MKVNILSNCCQNDYCIIDFIQTLNILPLLNKGPIPLLSRYLNGNPSPPPDHKKNPIQIEVQPKPSFKMGRNKRTPKKTGSNTKPRAYLEFHRWGTVKSGCFDKQLSNSANSVKTVAWQLSLEKVPWSLSAMEPGPLSMVCVFLRGRVSPCATKWVLGKKISWVNKRRDLAVCIRTYFFICSETAHRNAS